MEMTISIKQSSTSAVAEAIDTILGEKLMAGKTEVVWRLGIRLLLLDLKEEFSYTREFLRRLGQEDATSSLIHEDAFEFDTELFVECSGSILGEDIMPHICDVVAREISRKLESDVLVMNGTEDGVPFRYYSRGAMKMDFASSNSRWLDRLFWIPKTEP